MLTLPVNPHLELLLKAATEAVDDAKRAGRLVKVAEDWLVRRCRLDAGGRTQYFEPTKREVWDYDSLHRIVSEVIEEEAGTFESAVADLAHSGSPDLPTVRGHVRGLLVSVGRLHADARETHAIDELVARFLHELAGGAITWKATVWLQNIQVRPDLENLGERFNLRQPRDTDYESSFPAWLASFAQHESLLIDPDCVLQFHEKSTTRPTQVSSRFINCLCLFRVGAVSLVKEIYVSDSTLSGRNLESRPLVSHSNSRFKYVIAEVDRDSLARFFDKVAPLLPVRPLGHHDDSRWNGLKFYFRALHDATDDEERIAQAVATLEGLLCAGSRTDLTRTVSQRGASLLRLAGFEAIEVEQDLSRAYRIRSAFAHGEQASQKLRRNLPELCDRVMDYARLVVVKDIELRLLRDDQPLRRERLGALLDAALLDEDSRRSLEQQVQGGLWDLAGPSRPPRVGQ